MAKLFFPDRPSWDVQVARLVAEAEYGGADTFECFRTCERIKRAGATADTWVAEWTALARRLVEEATDGAADWKPSSIGASRKLMRAVNYFRTAELEADRSSGHVELFDAAREAFRRALPALPVETSVLEVPAEGTTYDGYVCRGRGATPERPGPGVVLLGGADSYAEELYFFGGQALADRGITVVVADTPGRGSTLRHKGIRTRADYEVPATKVLDALVGLDYVDANRVGVVGVSLGGYYAPRLAAADPRVRALVCWCACFDVLEDLYLHYPPIQPQMQWITGSSDDAEARAKLADFTLEEVAGSITCPVLISHGRDDDLMPASSAERLYAAVGSDEKICRIWEPEEGGALHCNYDNWAECVPFMFDWLAAKLGALPAGGGAPDA